MYIHTLTFDWSLATTQNGLYQKAQIRGVLAINRLSVRCGLPEILINIGLVYTDF